MNKARTGVKLLIVLVAVGMVGLVAASNMAFKYNAVIQNTNQRGGTAICNVCATWISLGFQNQFEGQRLSAVCDALTNRANYGFVFQTGGNCTGSGSTTVCDFTRLDSLVSRSCAVTDPNLGINPLFQPNVPLRLTLRAAFTGPDQNQIFVSADRPGTQQLLRHDTDYLGSCVGTVCASWVQLPLHTTARNLSDICVEIPRAAFVFQQGGACTGSGPTTSCDFNRIDSLVSRSCFVADPNLGINPPVQVGKGIRITLRTPTQAGGGTGDVLWSPAHF
jgi:hypothetical protein